MSHVTPAAHPERPERIGRLLKLAERARELGLTLFPSRRRATGEELGRVHTREYIDAISSTAGEDRVVLDADTHTSAESYDVARHAVGALLDMVDAVMEKRIDNGFAAVRPPGHHAETERAMGFCLFNNVSVAARHLMERHGIERILVVDWDVHHGNGTQNEFYDDPRVLFASLHQYPFYPGTGAVEETGEGEGAGYTINIPFPGGFGDGDYMLAFERVIVPVARKFAPEFVLISAGFDCHWSDPLASMQLSEDVFSAMTNRLLAVAHESAGGRLLATLEGGYNLDALVLCVERMLVAMQSFDPASTAPAVEAIDSMAEGLLAQVAGELADKWGI